LPILPIVFFLHKRSLPIGLKILVAPLRGILQKFNKIFLVSMNSGAAFREESEYVIGFKI
jgi:hypothetical protein